MERRIQEERHLRSLAESQLAAERKANKAEVAAFANNFKSVFIISISLLTSGNNFIYISNLI